MRKYNPNIYKGIHTVKITLQQWEYKGHIHLDAVDDGSWLEITKGTLEENFEFLEV